MSEQSDQSKREQEFQVLAQKLQAAEMELAHLRTRIVNFSLLKLRFKNSFLGRLPGVRQLYRLASKLYRYVKNSPSAIRLYSYLQSFLKSNEIVRLSDILQKSNFFDAPYYQAIYRDVAGSPLSPLAHYLEIGASENRRPNAFFDPEFYCQAYPDIKASGMEPVRHFYQYGWREGRQASELFQPLYYLSESVESQDSGIERILNDYYSGTLIDGELNPYKIVPASLRIKKAISECSINPNLKPLGSEIKLEQPENPLISIVIPIYNQIDFTLRCLRSIQLYSSAISYEVIVADDCSTDSSQTLLSQIPGLRYIRNPQNLGFLRSCNNAAKQARGKYLLLLNNDTVVLPGWLEALLDTYKVDSQTGLVGGKLIYPDGRLQEAGGIIWQDGSGTNCGRFNSPEKPEYNFMRSVDYCSGACIMLTKVLWDQLGGFDDRYAPAYYEDTDLAFRVRQQGLKVIYQPACEITHFEGISCGTNLSTGIKKYQLINQQKFVETWKQVLEQKHSAQIDHSLIVDRDKSKKILLIDEIIPTPDKDAGSLVNYYFVKLLCEMGYQPIFTAASNLAYQARYVSALQRLGVQVLYGPWIHSVENWLQLNAKSLKLAILFRPLIAQRFSALLRAIAPNVKVIFNTVDLHFLRLTRQYEIEKKEALLKQAQEFKKIEIEQSNLADAVILLNTAEIEALKNAVPEDKMYYLPIWKDLPGSRNSYEQRKDLVYIGGFNHLPNRDAVEYFIDQIWPKIRAELPEVKFHIVGSNMPDNIANIKTPGVVVRGYVENLDDIFDHCRLAIAPLRYGAGQKGKLVTSLSYGVPAVATSIATEGMGLIHNKNILVADSPEEFAAAVVRLYGDSQLWNSISQSSFEIAKESFSANSAELILNQLFFKLGLK